VRSSKVGAEMLAPVLIVSIYALWANALVQASHGNRWALWVTIGVSALSSLNGLTIVYCLPLCFFPLGDLSHIGSLVFGWWAIFESWRALRWNARASAAELL